MARGSEERDMRRQPLDPGREAQGRKIGGPRMGANAEQLWGATSGFTGLIGKGSD